MRDESISKKVEAMHEGREEGEMCIIAFPFIVMSNALISGSATANVTFISNKRNIRFCRFR